MARPLHASLSGALPRIQRLSGQRDVQMKAPPVVDEALRSPGQPLDPSTRAFFEGRFGYDFSHVRIHTGVQAAESARAIGSLAYTMGREIVVAEGRYRPESTNGRYLLAHELAHVIQQGNTEPIQSVRPVATIQSSSERQVQRQLDPNQLTCAALCAICAGTLIAPELILPEIACAMCFRLCQPGRA
ncbi:DUF4157 domain-containing protein [Azotobacter chroococcum subsp. isscasi]|nr:DUF4157 domain-containing protein [Azotobacter chroococcum subsp. isscasi]